MGEELVLPRKQVGAAHALRCIWITIVTAGLLLLSGCGEDERGPIVVSAIGSPPQMVNPNLAPLDAPSSILLQATAQGLVRFDATGQIVPALAQRWIVSDDGLRYTFRIQNLGWSKGGQVTADQVTSRLRAARSSASRNPLKPLLASIEDVEAMTGDVLELSVRSPHANFLQLLAQPEMAIVRNGQGTGPYRIRARGNGAFLLRLPTDGEEEEEDGHTAGTSDVLLRGERAALGVARFMAGHADLVTGGTAGDLPIVRAASPPRQALRFDPVFGLFGVEFTSGSGALARSAVRQALSMALDRAAMTSMLAVPDLLPRDSLVPPGLDELADPASPAWSALSLADRRARAARAVTAATGGEALRIRVSIPSEPGYRMLFALLRRDWRAIGVIAEPVTPGERADLQLVDRVAPAMMASWYLRSFSCAESRVCSEEADVLLDQARGAQTSQLRSDLLRRADQLMEDATVFIPIAAPVRWHLVSPRLTGFRTNGFARHPISELVAAPR